MFDSNKQKASTRWLPNLQVVRDRWGNPVGPTVRGRAPGGNASRDARDALNRTRWSLGLM